MNSSLIMLAICSDFSHGMWRIDFALKSHPHQMNRTPSLMTKGQSVDIVLYGIMSNEY